MVAADLRKTTEAWFRASRADLDPVKCQVPEAEHAPEVFEKCIQPFLLVLGTEAQAIKTSAPVATIAGSSDGCFWGFMREGPLDEGR